MTRLLTIFSITTIFSLQNADAKNCRALDVFTEGMTLSRTQRQINQDLAGMYKEKALVTQNFHDDRLDMMVDFVQGSLNRDGVMKIAERTHTERMDQDNEVQVLFTELLESLSVNQQTQLKQNLEAQRVCFAKKKSIKDETRPKVGEMLFTDLNLNDEQRAIIVEVWHDRQVVNASVVYGLHHEALLDDLFAGSLSMVRSSTTFEEFAKTQSVFRFNQMDAMMDLLSSFDTHQQKQFIANVRQVQAL